MSLVILFYFILLKEGNICKMDWLFEYQLLAVGFIFLFLFYVYDCFASMYVCVLHVRLFLQRPEEGCQIPWNWRCRRLGATMWVLGIEPGSSRRAASIINC